MAARANTGGNPVKKVPIHLQVCNRIPLLRSRTGCIYVYCYNTDLVEFMSFWSDQSFVSEYRVLKTG